MTTTTLHPTTTTQCDDPRAAALARVAGSTPISIITEDRHRAHWAELIKDSVGDVRIVSPECAEQITHAGVLIVDSPDSTIALPALSQVTVVVVGAATAEPSGVLRDAVGQLHREDLSSWGLSNARVLPTKPCQGKATFAARDGREDITVHITSHRDHTGAHSPLSAGWDVSATVQVPDHPPAATYLGRITSVENLRTWLRDTLRTATDVARAA